MVDNGVGVSEITSYKIKKIDLDYFTEEQKMIKKLYQPHVSARTITTNQLI